MECLYGSPVVNDIYQKIKKRIERLNKNNVTPCLAILKLYISEDDQSYISMIKKKCEKVGIKVEEFDTAEKTLADLSQIIEHINQDNKIHGCIVIGDPEQKAWLQTIQANLSENKDVDGVSLVLRGKLYSGYSIDYYPCTPEAVIKILNYYDIPIEGSNIAMLGRSERVGKPLITMLVQRNASVAICHSYTNNVSDICKRADVIISAIGESEFVNGNFIGSSDQIIIDVGINVGEDGKIHGDVDIDNVGNIIAAYTPVPGGVGPVTTAVLCEHVVTAAIKQNNL